MTRREWIVGLFGFWLFLGRAHAACDPIKELCHLWWQLAERKLPYLWGGVSIATGGNCSGIAAAVEKVVAKKCGYKSPKRTTADHMFRGLDGWASVDVPSLRELEAGDYLYIFRRERAVHTGIFLPCSTGELYVYHASGKYRHVVGEPLKGSVFDRPDLKIRRPTFR